MMENFSQRFAGDMKTYTLLKQIHKKLGSHFLTGSVLKETSESRRCYEEAVQRYFKQKILMDAVVKASYSQNERDESIPIFYLNAIPRYAPKCEPSLPFTADHVSCVLKNRKMSKSEVEEYSILVENKIAEFCKNLSEYTGNTQGASQNWKRAFNQTIHYISSKANFLDLETSKVRPHKLALQDMLFTYFTELTEGLSILKRLLNLYEKKFNFQLDLAQMFYLDSQCLLFKIKIFEWRALDSTYTNESLPALRMISDELDIKKETLVNDRDQTLSALEAYEALGSEFIGLAENYRQLTEKISQQKWAISTLTSTTSS